MLLQSTPRLALLPRQIISGNPFRNLVIPVLHRSNQRLHLLLRQLAEQATKRQEKRVIRHSFRDRFLVQNLRRSNPVQTPKQSLQIVIIIPDQTVVFPSSRQNQRRNTHEIVPVDHRTDRGSLVVRTTTTRPSHELELVLAVSL